MECSNFLAQPCILFVSAPSKTETLYGSDEIILTWAAQRIQKSFRDKKTNSKQKKQFSFSKRAPREQRSVTIGDRLQIRTDQRRASFIDRTNEV